MTPRWLIATAATATALAAVVLCSVPGWIAAAPDGPGGLQEDNPYPEVNPCASGVSEYTDTIKVCTLISELGEIRVYTETRRAMVWIQISETGPTVHVSDTLYGVAWVKDRVMGIPLTRRDDWYVSIQTWNTPPGVRLDSQLVFTRVSPGEARTFVFACDAPPCNRPAATSTATITSQPPNATRVPSPTSTLTATVAVSETPTLALPSPTATITATPTSDATQTPPLTSTASVTATATPDPTLTAPPPDTPSPTSTTEPGETAEPTRTPTPSDDPTPTGTAEATPTPPATPATPVPTGTPETGATATRYPATPIDVETPGPTPSRLPTVVPPAGNLYVPYASR